MLILLFQGVKAEETAVPEWQPISTKEELLALAQTDVETSNLVASKWTKKWYYLTNDIDMEGAEMFPIGVKVSNKVYPFKECKIDGKGFVISNLTIKPRAGYNTSVGLIGWARNSQISNLGLVNVKVNPLEANADAASTTQVGSFIGYGEWNGLSLENCFALGGSVTGKTEVGGLVGFAKDCATTNCFVDCNLITEPSLTTGILFGKLTCGTKSTDEVFLENLVGYGSSTEAKKFSPIGNDFTTYTGTGTEQLIKCRNNYVCQDITDTDDEKVNNFGTVLSAVELTKSTSYTGFDFTGGTGVWTMLDNSFAVLTAFNQTHYAAMKKLYSLPLVVKSGTDVVVDATVTIAGVEYKTNTEGKVEGLFTEGDVAYSVSKDGYQEISDIITVAESASIVELNLVQKGDKSLTIIVKNNKEVLVQKASVELSADGYSQTFTTDDNGQVVFGNLLEGEYSYSVSKEYHTPVSASVNVTEASQQLELTLAQIQTAPIISLVQPRNYQVGEMVKLDAAHTKDVNGDAMTFSWTVSPSVNLLDAETATPSFEASTKGTYTVTLTVNDGNSDAVESTTVEVRDDLVLGGELIPNGDFTADLTDWESTSTFEKVADPADADNSVMKLTYNAEVAYTTTAANNFLVEVGRTYLLKGLFRAEAMNLKVLRFQVEPIGTDNNRAKSEVTNYDIVWDNATQAKQNEWVEFEQLVTIGTNFYKNYPEGTVIACQFSMRGNTFVDPSITNNDIIYLDNLSLKEFDVTGKPLALDINAGEDRVVEVGTKVFLSAESLKPLNGFEWGLNPTDDQGNPITSVTLSSATAKSPWFIAPDVTEPTNYTFTLSVPYQGVTHTDDVVVTVAPAVDMTASAGEKQSVDGGTTVTLSGSGTSSSCTEDELTYAWEAPEGSNIVLTDAATKNPTFTAPAVLEKTSYRFTLTVTEPTIGKTATSVVYVDVAPAFIISAGEDKKWSVNTAEEYDLNNDMKRSIYHFDDATYSNYSCSVVWTSEQGIAFTDKHGKTTDDNGDPILDLDKEKKPYFLAPTTVQDLTFKLVATSPNGTVKEDEVVISLIEQPTIEITAQNSYDVLPGQTVEMSADYTPDYATGVWAPETGSDAITFVDPASSAVSFVVPSQSSNLEALDIMKFSFKTSFAHLLESKWITVTILDDLVADAGSAQTAEEESEVTLGASANVSTGVTYAWSAPEGIILNDASVANPTFTAPAYVEGETNEYTLSLTASVGTYQSTVSTVVTVTPEVKAIAGDDVVAYAGEEVSLDASASEPTQADVKWTAPQGISLTPEQKISRQISFIAPDIAVEKEYVFILETTVEQITKTDQVTVTVKPQVVAVVNDDFTVEENVQITLDGSSSAPATVTYAWSAPVEVVFDNATLAKPTITVPEFVESGTNSYAVKLVVTDGTRTAEDKFILTVSNELVITANAGANQTVTEGDVVTLDGSATVPTDVEFLWEAPEGSGIVLSDATVVDPTFTLPAYVEGADNFYLIKLTASKDGKKDSDDVKISVEKRVELAVVASDDKEVQEETTSSVTASATINGEASTAVTYAWTNTGNIDMVGADSATPSFTTPSFIEGGNNTYTFTVTTSAEGKTATDDVVVTVTEAPVVIVVEANAGANISQEEGTVVTLDGSATTPSDVTFAWTSADEITLDGADTTTPTFTAPAYVDGGNNTYTFTLTASKGDVTDTDDVVVTVTEAPVVVQVDAHAGADQTVKERTTVSLDGSATIPDDAELEWIVPAGSGIVLDDIHAVRPTFVVPAYIENGVNSYTFTLRASKNGVVDTDDVVFTLEVPTAIGDNDMFDAFKVYPNPTSGPLTIESKKDGTLHISNILGATIQQRALLQGKTDMDISNLPAGFYLFKLISEDGVKFQKVLKK